MKTYYLAPNATVVGQVSLGEDVSVWYGAVLRGDHGAITIGRGTNIQDNAVLHETLTVGEDCVIGHGAILHGCTIGSRCLIGMGAIVLSGAVLEEGCIVAAGALVTGKTHAPAGSVLMGSPAKVVKSATQEQINETVRNAKDYVQLARKAFG